MQVSREVLKVTLHAQESHFVQVAMENSASDITHLLPQHLFVFLTMTSPKDGEKEKEGTCFYSNGFVLQVVLLTLSLPFQAKQYL